MILVSLAISSVTPATKAVPRCSQTSLFWPPDRSTRCFLVSLSLSLWVPGKGLMCGTGHWLSEGVSNPSPASLEDFTFCWLLLDPFPEFSVADGLNYLNRWYLSHLLMHLHPVLRGLCWLLHCSWGPCSYPCGFSDQDRPNYLQPCWSSLASFARYRREEPGHMQSPGHQAGSESPLNSISPLGCGCLLHPVDGQYE